MNVEDVPQHKKNFKDGNQAPKKVLYVTDKDGAYTQTNSDGWEPENVVLEQTWQDIEIQLEEEKQRVLQGISSPIAYYMIKNRMDIGILASYVGKWQWQVKRHCKPSVFKSLSDSLLQKYATIFNININELKSVN